MTIQSTIQSEAVWNATCKEVESQHVNAGIYNVLTGMTVLRLGISYCLGLVSMLNLYSI